MKTIIPNEVRFDLNLQDLPVRATEVSLELLGSGYYKYCKNFRIVATNQPGRPPIWVEHLSVADAESDCRKGCGTTATAIVAPAYDWSYPYWQCSCCYR